MTAERGSRSNSALATKSPAAIHVNKERTAFRSSGFCATNSEKAPAARRKESPALPHATMETAVLGKRLPSRPFTADPARGSNGISHKYLITQTSDLRLQTSDFRPQTGTRMDPRFEV